MDKTIQYIRSLLEEDTDCAVLRQGQEARHIPVIRPEALRLLTILLKVSKSTKVLEIGTGEGYSAICFARAIGKQADITTIDHDEERVKAARDNIVKFQLENAVTVIYDDAEKACRSMAGEELFDLIFLDGAKTHYLSLLEDCIRLVKTGGLIVADNVLYFGMVPGEKQPPRKKRTSTTHLRDFLEAVTTHPRLLTQSLILRTGFRSV